MNDPRPVPHKPAKPSPPLASTDVNPDARVVAPVAAQLEAYNAGDVDAFVEAFSADVVGYNAVNGEILFEGEAQLHSRYAELFKNSPDLHCEVTKREVDGQFVTDTEQVTGRHPTPDAVVHAEVKYLVKDGQISQVWFKILKPDEN